MWCINEKLFVCICVSILVICNCYGESPPLKEVRNIFEALGYSPSCVAVALATCTIDVQLLENSTKSSFLQDKTLNKQNTSHPRNYTDLHALGDMESGIRTVYPFSCCPNRPVSVSCDQATDGGGWTVFQRLDVLPQREDFYRTWIEYVLGFGNLTGEFWLGLDQIHAITSTTLMELRVDLDDFKGDKRFTMFGIFHVGDSESKYILSVGRYSGDAGDNLSGANGNKFSTHDADHDTSSLSCAKQYRGAIWYFSCHSSNLNGFQYERAHTTHADGINWHDFKGHYYSLKKTEMKMRPKFKNY